MPRIMAVPCLIVTLSVGAASPEVTNSAAFAQAGTSSVSGVWRVDIEYRRGRCRWQGEVELEQDGESLAGSGEAEPPRSLRWCPRLKGKINGRVDGQRVRFGFATGRLGTADFDGVLEPDEQTLRGRWQAGSAAGTWRAERAE